MKQKISYIFVYLLPFILAGALLGWINTLFLLIIFLFYFMLLSIDGMTIAAVFILCPLLGLIKDLIGSPLPGTVVAFLLILLLQRENIINFFQKRDIPALTYILIIFTIISGFYFATSSTSYGSEKYVSMLLTLVVNTIGLLSLSKSSKDAVDVVSPLFLIYGIILLRFPIDFYGYAQPASLFDFEFYRASTVLNKYLEIPYISYHATGIAALLSMSFLLCNKRRLEGWGNYIQLFTCAWLILLSGARQTIIGFIIIAVIWLIVRSSRFKVWNLLLAIAVIYFAFIFLKEMDVEYIQFMFEENSQFDENLNRNYEYPIQLIEENPVVGVGFGNYFNPQSHEYYPHNIFLEILCEMGFVGLFMLLFPTIAFAIMTKASLSAKLENGSLCLIILLPYAIRSMISGDLSLNIMVFLIYSILFFPSEKDDEDELDTDEVVTEDIYITT